MQKLLSVFTLLLLTAACSIPSLDSVLSDERTEYKKSEPLPPLELPPDLAAAEASENMTIPGETGSATYNDFKNQSRDPRTAPVQETATAEIATTTTAANTATATTLPATVAVTPDQTPNVIVSARGEKQELWNRLKTFMTSKGFQLDLDDFELGYLETQWSAPHAENGQTFRYKFKLYSEPGPEAGVTLFYIDNVLQEQVSQDNGNVIWADRNGIIAAEHQLARQMNAYFNGEQQESLQPQELASSAANASLPATPAPVREDRVVIQDIGDGKILLAITEEYTLAWRHTEQALQAAGLIVNSKEQEQGVYYITYANAGTKQGGWMKKLKFWGDDKPKGTNYQIALTGVGDKTELVLLDEGGKWVSSETAEPILTMIKTQYNIL